jgi:hypothetical protein
MSLYDRLSGQAGDKIPVSTFCSALFEWAAGSGQVSRAGIIASFNLADPDETNATNGLDFLRNTYVSVTDANPLVQDFRRFEWLYQLQSISVLAEENRAYVTEAAWLARLTALAGG